MNIMENHPLPCLTTGGQLLLRSRTLLEERSTRQLEEDGRPFTWWIDVDRSVKVVKIGSIGTFTKCTAGLDNVRSNLFQDQDYKSGDDMCKWADVNCSKRR